MSNTQLRRNLKEAVKDYWLKHREAYENEIQGKYANKYTLHEEVRQASFRVVLAAEKLLKEIQK